MIGKIALEEHFELSETSSYAAGNLSLLQPKYREQFPADLFDMDRRVQRMEEGGIDIAVLSLSAPGVQVEPDVGKATAIAARVNDRLAELMMLHAGRFGGFAHLAVQDPESAADELERCVTQLGMQGALVNGATLGEYMDGERFLPLWERSAALGAPIYLHPGVIADIPAALGDYVQLYGAMWGWAFDTGSHVLRLMLAGVFDRFPDLKIIIGHMGEHLPFSLWRLDSRYEVVLGGAGLKKKPSEYIRANVLITTSGVCAEAPLRCAIDEMGIDQVMFASDYPYEDMQVACDFIDSATLSEQERSAIAKGNALRELSWRTNLWNHARAVVGTSTDGATAATP